MRPSHFLPLLVCAAATAVLSPSAAWADGVDFDYVRDKAKARAERAYRPPESRVPKFLLDLTYDQHREIAFRPEESLWHKLGLPFQAQFFIPGHGNGRTVRVNEVAGLNSFMIPFDARLFDTRRTRLPDRIPADMGFSGFRLLYPLNKPGDELGAFQGASYFRMLCRGSVYGLSARGLAIGTGEPEPEEFPIFEEFWLVRPRPVDRQMTVYALLNSPSAAGAYEFVIRPGEETAVSVRAVVYTRAPVQVLGLAPLTSMYWYGEAGEDRRGDFRPEVHDSDGLLIHFRSGEWLWRPLSNPSAPRVASFHDDSPRGFGLVQRDRRYESYEDAEGMFHRRPTAWVEPVGSWGPGAVRLLELPTPDESNDNIAALWVPDQVLKPGRPYEFRYQLTWSISEAALSPGGRAVATRQGVDFWQPDRARRKFIIDFDGPPLRALEREEGVEAVVSAGAGAEVLFRTVHRNPVNGTWRVIMELKPDGSGKPVELRCFLKRDPDVLTETWSYLWNP